MPGYDRTGPMGEGPRTGWGMGDCYGDAPARGRYYRAGWGRGWGRGWGPGRGRGWGFGFRRGFPFGWGARGRGWVDAGPVAEPPAEDELTDLDAEAKWLQDELDAVRARMEALRGRSTEE